MDAARAHSRHRRVLATLVVLALLSVSEGWWWRDAALRARRAHRELEQKRREWQTLARLAPSPTPAVAQEMENELARRRQVLAELERQLGERGPLVEALRAAAPAPGQTDEFFAAAAFRARMRAHARAGGIAVKEDERFGFEDGRRPVVDARPPQAEARDRLAAEHLLGALFAARPAELVAIERKVTPDTNAHAAQPVVFRLVFAGETRALRGFLNGLAEVALPWRVREVDVEATGRPAVTPGVSSDTAVPLVPRTSSRFVVTVELAVAPREERG